MTSKRITAAYYDPQSGAVRVLGETGEQVGYIDTLDLAELHLRNLRQAVIDMHVAAALKNAKN